MIEEKDIKVGTLLKFIDDEAREDFVEGGHIHNEVLVDLYYKNGYFEVNYIKIIGKYYSVGSEEDDILTFNELKYFKIYTPISNEQSKLSEAAELIKDLVSGHEFDSSYINAGMRMRVNKFLRSIGEK